MRKLPALIFAAALVASLAACSSSPASADCTPAAAGDASPLVTAKGAFLAKPTVDFPTPLVTKKVQVTDLTVGTGMTLQSGDYADLQVSVWDAATGDLVTATTFDKATPTRQSVGGTSSFGPILECATVGSRIAAVTTLKQLFGSVDTTGTTLKPSSTLVAIVDVQNGMIGKANGAHQIPQAGFPSIVTAPDGTPGVTLLDKTPPTTLEHTVLKAGSGAVVKKGDEVVIKYTGVTWDASATVFKSTWGDTPPETYLAEKYNASTTSGLFPGTASAIIGQKVGSQVLVVVPPKDSYDTSTAAAPDGAAKGSTRIYVIDILDVTK
ncbi:FKBP-type peptidyl-prolyl cis-trans isomerase [soil metagenome]